jgi:hypothetical protein
MTPETAQILARAIKIRDEAADAAFLLTNSITYRVDDLELLKLAEIYVHEQRIINRIVAEQHR